MYEAKRIFFVPNSYVTISLCSEEVNLKTEIMKQNSFS